MHSDSASEPPVFYAVLVGSISNLGHNLATLLAIVILECPKIEARQGTTRWRLHDILVLIEVPHQRDKDIVQSTKPWLRIIQTCEVTSLSPGMLK